MMNLVFRGAEYAAPFAEPIMEHNVGFQLVVGGAAGLLTGVGVGAGLFQASGTLILGRLFVPIQAYFEEYGDDSSEYYSESTKKLVEVVLKVALIALPMMATAYLAPSVLGFAAKQLPLLARVWAPEAAAGYTFIKGGLIALVSIVAFILKK